MESFRTVVSDIILLFHDQTSNDDHSQTIPLEGARLAARIRAGDEAAFEELVLSLSPSLIGYARRFTRSTDLAREVVQEVFANLWMRRETLRIRGSVRTYLYSSVRNRTFNALKSDRAQHTRSIDVGSAETFPETTSVSEHPDVILERQEIESRVRAALDTLPPRTREAALLRWQDGLSRGEIAAVMGVAVPTVNNQLTTAAKVMRRLLLDLRNSA